MDICLNFYLNIFSLNIFKTCLSTINIFFFFKVSLCEETSEIYRIQPNLWTPMRRMSKSNYDKKWRKIDRKIETNSWNSILKAKEKELYSSNPPFYQDITDPIMQLICPRCTKKFATNQTRNRHYLPANKGNTCDLITLDQLEKHGALVDQLAKDFCAKGDTETRKNYYLEISSRPSYTFDEFNWFDDYPNMCFFCCKKFKRSGHLARHISACTEMTFRADNTAAVQSFPTMLVQSFDSSYLEEQSNPLPDPSEISSNIVQTLVVIESAQDIHPTQERTHDILIMSNDEVVLPTEQLLPSTQQLLGQVPISSEEEQVNVDLQNRFAEHLKLSGIKMPSLITKHAIDWKPGMRLPDKAIYELFSDLPEKLTKRNKSVHKAEFEELAQTLIKTAKHYQIELIDLHEHKANQRKFMKRANKVMPSSRINNKKLRLNDETSEHYIFNKSVRKSSLQTGVSRMTMDNYNRTLFLEKDYNFEDYCLEVHGVSIWRLMWQNGPYKSKGDNIIGDVSTTIGKVATQYLTWINIVKDASSSTLLNTMCALQKLMKFFLKDLDLYRMDMFGNTYYSNVHRKFFEYKSILKMEIQTMYNSISLLSKKVESARMAINLRISHDTSEETKKRIENARKATADVLESMAFKNTVLLATTLEANLTQYELTKTTYNTVLTTAMLCTHLFSGQRAQSTLFIEDNDLRSARLVNPNDQRWYYLYPGLSREEIAGKTKTRMAVLVHYEVLHLLNVYQGRKN